MKKLVMAHLAISSRPAANLAATTLTIIPQPAAVSSLTSESATTEVLQKCIQYSPKRPTGPNSGRNNWLSSLTHWCNEVGVAEAELLSHALTYWVEPDFEAREIEQLIRRIYRTKVSKHNSRPFIPAAEYQAPPRPAPAAAPVMRVAVGEDEPPLFPPASPPAFPADLYAALPSFLQRVCQPFTGHEADVLLTAACTLLSGVFPAVRGVYDGRQTGLNMYSFISAPAASGKGNILFALTLLRVRQRQLERLNQQAQEAHERELLDYQAHKRSAKAAAGPAPTEPARKLLLLPADASFAALVQALADNHGQGVICETEADVLSAILKNSEWGNYGPLLRNGFHHEPYSTLRKGSGYLHIERPVLSVLLTGTPKQIKRLVPDVENGLFSRFLFYTYTSEKVQWRDTFAQREPLEPHYEQLGEELVRMIAAVPAPVTIELSDEQQQRHQAAFTAWTLETDEAYPAQHSTLRRLGLCAFRLAMLLTLLRAFEDGVAPTGTLVCGDQDFETAMTLIAVFRVHANQLLHTLAPVPATSPAEAQAALKAQAQELQAAGQSIRQIAEQLGVAKSVVGRWLREAAGPATENEGLDQAA